MRKHIKLLAAALVALFLFTAATIGTFVFAQEENTVEESGADEQMSEEESSEEQMSEEQSSEEQTSEEESSEEQMSEEQTSEEQAPEEQASEEERYPDEQSSQTAAQEDGSAFIDKVTLLDSDGNEIAGEVSLSKRYRLRYDLISPLQIKLNETDVMMPPYMEKGKEYLFPEISDDFINFTGDITVKASDSSGNTVTVATIRIGDDKIPVFIVEADLDKGNLLGGYFEIEVNLNQETIGDSDEHIFEFPNGRSQTAQIAENRKLPPTVSKEAAKYDPDGKTITWRITVKNAKKPMESLYPLKLSDIIGEGQTYIDGSLHVINSSEFLPEQVEYYDNLLTWELSIATGDATIQYEYQTKVDILELLKNNITNDDFSVSAQNTLSVTEANDSKAVDDITAQQTITGKTPVSLSKSGAKTIVYNEDDNTGEIEWTITVTNNGYDIRDLTVYDYIEAGAASARLKGTPVCSPQPTGNGKGYNASPGYNNGKYYRWSYHIGDVSGDITYTITYTTIIDNYSDYLRRNNGVQLRNEAWFSFAYLSKEFHGPVMSMRAEEVHANIIEKTGTYDPATHHITWTITANPNQIELPNARITENILQGQRYIRSYVDISEDVNVTTTVDRRNNTVTFDFGESGLSGRRAVITLLTELEDSESDKWANNWSGTVENNVTLNADGLAPNGVSDTGITSVKSMVIDKELGAFNYANHTIPVTVFINQNHLSLTGTVVTDKLSDYGLALAEEKGIQIDGVSINKGTKEKRPSYSYDGNTLEIYPQEPVTSEIKITFTAQSTDEYMNIHRTQDVINFENTATLTSKQYSEEVSARDTANMKNRPIVKDGIIDNRACTITYTVEFNRTLLDLPEGVVLTDILPDGLQYRLTTVKLWIADVNSSTGEMTKSGTEAAGYATNIFVSGENTIMQVSLPAGRQAYILEYDVQIVDKDKSPFVNRVNVSGFTGDDRIVEGSLSVSREQVAGARLEDLIYLKVKKVDSYDNPLVGAVFALKQNGEQLMIGATREDGYITFVGVAENTEYTIVEIQAPEGYIPSSKERTITTGTKGGAEYALEETFVNQEDTGQEDTSQEDTNQEETIQNSGSGSGDKAPIGERFNQFFYENPMDTSRNMPDYTPDNTPQNTPETQDNLEKNDIPEINRLPKTGGFWGSGLMYITGAILIMTGAVVLRFSAKSGCSLMIIGVILIMGTLSANLHIKWKNFKEANSFEEELLLTQPTQHEELSDIEIEIKPETETSAAYDAPDSNINTENKDDTIAVISIPSISCKEIVREGSSSKVLAKALGHMENTAFPGQSGNCVIAGHRNYSFGLHFNRLNEVEIGDEITVATREGTYTYTVTQINVVEPEDVSVLAQTHEPRLTLITCTPIYIATHRLIIVAELNETP